MRVLLLAAFASVLLAAAAHAAGDPVRGARLYEENCTGCHSLDADRVGPRHRGVFGRKAGAVPGFDYSEALRRSTVVWNESTLNQWLISPMDYIRGTTMPFRIGTPQVREDIIAYLRRESGR